jgi:hypothetical protein
VRGVFLQFGVERVETGRFEPVTFETSKLGQYRTIASASEAAHALTGSWPIEDGKALRKACETCLAVLEGKEAPDAARKAFLRAAKEARVFVRAS